MKNLLSFLFLFLFFPVIKSQNTPSLLGCSDETLMYKYWEMRNRFNKNFIRTEKDDLNDDCDSSAGIGTWDSETCMYSSAGNSIPAAFYTMQGWVGCYDAPGGNILKYGDAGIHLGYYLATLATEYKLLSQNGQATQMECTAKELFLALQAYRRLDMTANRIHAKWNEENDPDCEWTPDLSGVSGFFIRDDVSPDYAENFQGSTASDYPIDYAAGDFHCGDVTEGENPLDSWMTESGGGPEGGGGNIMSIDQVVGLMFGLSFVADCIPDNLKVCGSNIKDLTMSISDGLVGRLGDSRRIRYPECTTKKVKRGSYGGGFYAALAETANEINPTSPHDISLLDWAIWGAGVDFGIGDIGSSDHNVRMYLEAAAISGLENIFELDEVALAEDKFHPVLAAYLLNQGEPGFLKNNISPLTKLLLKDDLCRLTCQGPCYDPTDTFGDCEEYAGWLSGSKLVDNHNYPNEGDPDQGARRGSGLDYLLLYNLYHLTYTPDEPYFNPTETASTIEGENIDVLSFENDVLNCHSENSFSIPDAMLEGIGSDYSVTWTASEGVEILHSDNQMIVFDISNTPEVIIQASIYDENGCLVRVIRSSTNLEIPFPDFNHTLNCFENILVLQIANNNDYSTIDWQVETFPNFKAGNKLIVFFDTDTEFVQYQLTITNACGEEKTFYLTEYIDCESNDDDHPQFNPKDIVLVKKGETENFYTLGSTHVQQKTFVRHYNESYKEKWTRVWTGTNGIRDLCNGIKYKDEVLGIGYFSGTLMPEDNSSINLASLGEEDIFLVGYNQYGELTKTEQIGGIGSDMGTDLTTDLNDNLYITGLFSDKVKFGTIEVSSEGETDGFLAKILPNSSVEWVKKISGQGIDKGIGVVTDRENNIFLLGKYEESIQIDEMYLTTPYNFCEGVFIAKFDLYGNILWITNGYGTNLSSIAGGIDVDDNGNVYFINKFDGHFILENNEQVVESYGQNDAMLLKFLPNGELDWTSQIGYTSNNIDPTAIKVDNDNNIYIGGQFRKKAGLADARYSDINSNGKYDIFIAKYHSDGRLMGSLVEGGIEDDFCSSLTINSDDKITCAGYFLGSPIINRVQYEGSLTASHDYITGFFDNFCKENYTFSSDAKLEGEQFYEALDVIEAENFIGVGTNIIYDAGECILLKPGFEIEIGGQFEATTDGCDGNTIIEEY